VRTKREGKKDEQEATVHRGGCVRVTMMVTARAMAIADWPKS
jgi:hypothetical protein